MPKNIKTIQVLIWLGRRMRKDAGKVGGIMYNIGKAKIKTIIMAPAIIKKIKANGTYEDIFYLGG